MAACIAFTLENPRAVAAALRSPNCRASAATLWPLQFENPFVPAKLGRMMKIPKATGVVPTAIVAVPVVVAVAIPAMVLETAFATETFRRSGLTATPMGLLPTAIVAVTVFVVVAITDTVLEPWFAT